MTHDEIMASLRKEGASRTRKPAGTIGDYISLAVANEWPEIQIVETLSTFLQQTTGIFYWSQLHELVRKYTERYDKDFTKWQYTPKKGEKIDGIFSSRLEITG